jgi:hypothetical protein
MRSIGSAFRSVISEANKMITQYNHVKTRRHFPQVGKVDYPLYHDAVDTPPAPTDIKVGDIVTFTNDYGVQFPGVKVTGFAPIVENGRFIYLDYDCYWFAAHPKELKVTKPIANGL